jgi:hypothetical protein
MVLGSGENAFRQIATENGSDYSLDCTINASYICVPRFGMATPECGEHLLGSPDTARFANATRRSVKRERRQSMEATRKS